MAAGLEAAQRCCTVLRACCLLLDALRPPLLSHSLCVALQHFAHCWDHVRSMDGGAGVHLLGQATRMENELEGDRKSLQYVQLLKGLFEHRLDHLSKLCKAGGEAEDAKLEDLMFSVQQGIKVAYGYHALLEDDNEYFEHMLSDTATLAQR